MKTIDVKITEYDFLSIIITIQNHLNQINKYFTIIDESKEEVKLGSIEYSTVKHYHELINDRLLILEGIIQVMDLCTRFMTDEPIFRYEIMRKDYIKIKERFYYDE